MPINQNRGACRYCGRRVGRKKGWAERSKSTGLWLVWHRRCDPGYDAATEGRAGKFGRKPEPLPVRPPYYVDTDD